MIRRNFFTDLIIAILFWIVALFAFTSKATFDNVTVLGFQLPTICLFKRLTGLDCPGCGLTRAVILAFHGQFHESFLRHVLGIPMALFLIVQIPYRTLVAISGNDPIHFSPTFERWVNLAIALLFLVPWLVKMTIFAVAKTG